MRRVSILTFVVVLTWLLPGCSTLVDGIETTSSIAERAINRALTPHNRQQVPNQSASQVVSQLEPNIPKDLAVPVSAPAPVARQGAAVQESNPPKSAAEQEMSSSITGSNSSIRNAGTADTSTQVLPQGIALSDGLRRTFDLYGRFQYSEAIDQSLRVFSDEQIRVSEKALALIIAAASTYVLGQHEKCRDFLLMAAETDSHVIPNPNVFPSEVCRIHRAARANSK